MKARVLLFATLYILALSHVPAGEPATNLPVRLIIVGDSTVCNYPDNSVRRGWGMFIQDYFDRRQLQVINLALSGRSTKTFIQEGHWAEALGQKPDYVLIQFGHNDSHTPDHPEATDAGTNYRQYLRQYLAESRAAGIKPILVTPMCRRNFAADGRVRNELLPYVNAMKEVAREDQVPLVDLNTASVQLCNQLGPNGSLAFANEAKDGTHFNAKGAREMARLVMESLPVVEPSLKPYLVSH